jgi:hypothetical protein
MNYMLLLANAPDAWDDTDARPANGQDDGVIEDWVEYTRALHDAGVLVAGHGLHGNETATAVRVRNGDRLLIDGPFADTKEHLVGYYIIDVRTWTLPSAGPPGSRTPAPAPSRSGRSWPDPTRRRSRRQGVLPGTT